MRAALGADMPLARLVLAKGTERRGVAFNGRKLPTKLCFQNALKYADRHGLLYAEGYGLPGELLAAGFVFPVEHAWCVDLSGNVVDPTWSAPENSCYLGIEFGPREVWARVKAKGTFGMFQAGSAGIDDLKFMESVMPGLKPGVVHDDYLPRPAGP